MTTDHSPERPRIEFALQDDARLYAGVRAIVFHSAEQAGLDEHTKEQLAGATLEICRGAFAIAHSNGRGDSAIKLIVGGASDQIEITIEYPGHIPRNSIGDSLAKACAGQNGAGRVTGIDQVRCENTDNGSRVILIKRCSSIKAESRD